MHGNAAEISNFQQGNSSVINGNSHEPYRENNPGLWQYNDQFAELTNDVILCYSQRYCFDVQENM